VAKTTTEASPRISGTSKVANFRTTVKTFRDMLRIRVTRALARRRSR
jgi:hypothetical protein